MLRVQLNTYEGAKPSLANARNDNLSSAGRGGGGGGGSEHDFCSPEKSLECFFAIVGTR